MLASFSNFVSRQSLVKKVFLAIIVFAILVRIFVLFTMPDAPMTDTIYHFAITKYIVQNHAIPFNEIPETGPNGLPVPLYHILMAAPFILLSLDFNIATVRIFPFIFSFLQLLLAFLLLKKFFPKNWIFGFAFVAMQPFLVIFGGLNYIETFASVTVLLCFFVYWRFVQTGRKTFVVLMPFTLALMALSKESATILVPAFFLAFVFEMWKKNSFKISKNWLAKASAFTAVSVFLCSFWFLANFLIIGKHSHGFAGSIQQIITPAQIPLSLESIFLFPLNFNSAFWFFLAQGFESMPFGISPETAFIAFSLVTLPVLAILFYGLAKGVAKKEKQSFLLLLCFASSLSLLVSRARIGIYARLLVPMLPLFGIAFCTAFRELKNSNWQKIATFFFLLTAVYSLAFSSLYAMHFANDYNSHRPLYEFAKALPSDSKIAIHANKQRQVGFISEKETASHFDFQGMGAQQLASALNAENVSHVAITCYKNPWDMEAIGQLVDTGILSPVFEDKCSTLYKVSK